VPLVRDRAPRRVYASLFEQDRTLAHWSLGYAQRLAAAVAPEETIVIQTSMSPTGPFHIGNFRDTACAYAVHRALTSMGRRSAILMSFDDYDRVRPSTARVRDDLAGREGAALADGARTRAICRAYIAELKAVGICPSDADADGRGAAGWETHYQAERYREGRYAERQRDAIRLAPKLARLLGAGGASALFSVYCEQCERDRTEILELGADRVRYTCSVCGAVATTRDVRRVKPRWAVDWTLRVVHEGIACEPAGQDHCSAGSTMDRTPPVYARVYRRPQPVIVPYGLVRQFGGTAKISGSRGGGLTVSDLLRVMTPQLVLWLYLRRNCKSDIRISLDRAALFAYHAEYDRLAGAASTSQRSRVLLDLVGGAAGAPLPSFRAVVALLQAHWFDAAVVVRELGDERQEVRARVAHAHAWLRGHGRSHAWLVARAVAAPPAVPPQDAARMLAPGYLGGRRTRAEYRELYLALFATTCGPPLRRIVAAYGEQGVRDAIETVAERGERPLRTRLLASLDGGPEWR
jgi:lysyl-tRNA synthetase, class I